MNLPSDTQDILAVGTVAVLYVVWLIRLEGKINAVDKDNTRLNRQVENLEEKHTVLEQKIVNELSEVNQKLSRIQGFLERDKE